MLTHDTHSRPLVRQITPSDRLLLHHTAQEATIRLQHASQSQCVHSHATVFLLTDMMLFFASESPYITLHHITRVNIQSRMATSIFGHRTCYIGHRTWLEKSSRASAHAASWQVVGTWESENASLAKIGSVDIPAVLYSLGRTVHSSKIWRIHSFTSVVLDRPVLERF